MDTIKLDELCGIRLGHNTFGEGEIVSALVDNNNDISVTVGWNNNTSNIIKLIFCLMKNYIRVENANFTEKNLKKLIRYKKENRSTAELLTEMIPGYRALEEGVSAGVRMSDEEEKAKIMDYLVNERHIKYLVHFTPMENLPGIASRGIVPRSMLREGEAVFTDSRRLDNLKDCSSFSISYPNKFMLSKKRKQFINGKYHDFAVILIDIGVLKNIDYEDIYFFYDNAANHKFKQLGQENFHGMNAVKKMFDCDFFSNNQQAQFTENQQAEIMLRAVIPSRYICQVHYSTYGLTNSDVMNRIKLTYGEKLIRSSQYFE